MGNICCGETSTDDFKANGKLRNGIDEENPLQTNNQEPLELQHISEREYGIYKYIYNYKLNYCRVVQRKILLITNK